MNPDKQFRQFHPGFANVFSSFAGFSVATMGKSSWVAIRVKGVFLITSILWPTGGYVARGRSQFRSRFCDNEYSHTVSISPRAFG